MQTEFNPHSGARYLSLAVAFAVALASGTYFITKNKRERTRQTVLAQQIKLLLPANEGNLEVNSRSLELTISPAVILNVLHQYKSTLDEGSVMQVTSTRGYSGDIQFLIAMNNSDQIQGVTILHHTETPGLGDRIDARHSNWLEQFIALDFKALPQSRWQVKNDGGQFDQITGATITARAVVNAIYDAASWLATNRDTLKQ